MLFKALAFFINFLYPPTCIICGKSANYYICEKCNKRIKKYEEYHYLSRDEDNNYPIRHYDELIYILRYEKIKESNNLKKVNNTLTQGKLNRLERINNIEGIYYIENNLEFIGKRIVLLDDIYTTGSTIEECARVISKSGAKEIFVIILARDFMK